MKPKLATPFEIREPRQQTCPILFNSPHSGRHYPQSFVDMSQLSPHEIRKSEDSYVDELFSFVPDIGACLMHAFFPRAYLDLNREAYELDPKMFEGSLPEYVNTHSNRAKLGLGTIARIVSENADIYPGKINVEEALNRIETLYHPYHAALENKLTELFQAFGSVLLVDCHSMPAKPFEDKVASASKADIILGNNFNTSCNSSITDLIDYLFSKMGYRVERNYPYAGGFITQKYGHAKSPQQSIQIEINRSLYMNEASLEIHSGFETLSADLKIFAMELQENISDMLLETPIAAE